MNTLNIFDKIIFSIILISATQLTRFLPLILSDRIDKIVKKSKIQNQIGNIIIFGLILYCYRDVQMSAEFLLRVSTGIVAVILQWFIDSSLLSIFSATAIYMLGRHFL